MSILTKKQKTVFEAIKNFYSERSKMPTVREIKDECAKLGLEIKSIRSVFLYLNILEEKGLIKRNSKSRGIELAGQNIENSLVDVPILGTASAGAPTFFAEENIEGFLKISRRLVRGGNHFAVRVSGNSMNEAIIRDKKIRNGDYIIINPDDKNYRNNDRVLVAIDGLATAKKFKKIDKSTIGLFPESSDIKYKPIYITLKDESIICGKIVDIFPAPENKEVEYVGDM
ncbi:MAG: transcriptional repressor LexA, partial [bacterium]